jgi:hypothetical protein
LRGDDVIEKRLSPHLNHACDKRALGISVKDGREGIEARREKVAIGEATLYKQTDVSVSVGSHTNRRGIWIPK